MADQNKQDSVQQFERSITMRLRIAILGVLACLLVIPIRSHAQQQNSSTTTMVRLRVDIVLNEYSGEKKISSLPYTIYVGAGSQNVRTTGSNLRMGVRVPVSATGGKDFQYMNVGTDIDCGAQSRPDGLYDVVIGVSRSSIYSSQQQVGSQQLHADPDTPVIRTFNSHFDVFLRDGETKEGVSAADPLNGNVLKISVTLHVMK